MKRFTGVLFWILTVFYMEMVFKISLFDNALNYNIIFTFLFSLPIALFIYFLTSIFNHKINTIIRHTIVLMLIIIFVTQLIYYKTYLSIFSIFSMKEAGQLLEYIDTIVKIILRNWVSIMMLLVPVAISILFNKKLFEYKLTNYKSRIVVGLLIILFQIMSVVTLNYNKKDVYSAYDLYHNIHSPTLTTNKIGLLTMMRLDLKRMLWGFEIKENSISSSKNKETKVKPIAKPIEYNIMDIDFDKLISEESNSTIKSLHSYFKNVEPTKKNEYTGIFKGKNLIVFLAESFHPIAIDKELTPTLYKLSTEGFRFTNFYTPLYPVSTSDGEYLTVTSLIPKEGVWSALESSDIYLPFVLGNSFKATGYKTTAYHNHSAIYYYRHLSHPNFGYEYFACGRGLDINCNQWPESDLEMIDATYDQYINNEPFLTYYITVSGHLRYNKYNSMSLKNWDAVKDLDYSTAIKAYIAANIEFDKALEQLIKQLEIAGVLDDTVIAVTGDHYPYGLTLDEMKEKAAYPLDEDFEKHRMSLLLWNNATEGEEIKKYGSSFDVLPTLLNLFGQEYDSRLLMGRDLFSDAESLVIFSNRSFITEKGRYNTINNKFYRNDGAEKEIDEHYLNYINQIIYDRFYVSTKILETNYYHKVMPQKQD